MSKSFDLVDALATTLRRPQFRGKARLAELMVPRSGERDALIFGARFSLDTSDFIQRHMYAGSYEAKESHVVRKTLRPGMTFVDVGANVGYYTALAVQSVGPLGSVFAFEPSEYAFPRLSRMIENNCLTTARPAKCALADVPGEGVLYGGVDDDLFDNHTATMVPNDNPNKTIVHTETIDRIAEQLDIKQIDFLKIDVDGFELLVLQGASGMMAAARISNIMLECTDYWLERMNTSSAGVLEYLRSKGFNKISRIGKSDNYLVSL